MAKIFTDDDILSPAQPQTAQGQKVYTDDDIDGAAVANAPVESRKGAALLNGLTFGLRPRIAAAIETGAVSGPEYEQAKQQEWAKDDAYSKSAPLTSMALEVAGSIPTMFVPGLGAGRLAQAANRAGDVTQGLGRAQRMSRAAGIGPEIGTIGQEAGALGAKTAAITGGFSSREDDLSNRLGDAASAAPLGYGLGRAGDAAGRRLAGVGEQVYDMARVGGNAQLGALTGLRRGLERDGTTTDALRAAILPDTGRAQIAPQGRETILRAFGDAQAQGLDERAARQAATTAYEAQSRANGVRLTADTLRGHTARVLDSYGAANEIPLAIDEVARVAGGRGQNMQWTRRAAASSPGEGREQIARSVMDRQDDIIDTVRNRVTNTLGDPDYEGNLNRLISRNRPVIDSLYDNARANETPFNLEPVFDEIQNTYAYRAGGVKSAVDSALETMRGVPDANGRYNRHTLDTFIQSRGELNDLIDASKNKFGQSTTATRALMDMKTKIDEIVTTTNPQWKIANDLAADGRAVQNAMRDGERMSLDFGSKHTREMVNKMRDWRADVVRLGRLVNNRTATPEDAARLALRQNQIEAMQLGFARPVHTRLSGLGDTHDVSKLFSKGGRRSQDGVRRIVSEMMGDESQAFMDLVERAKIATSTARTYGQSQTTPLREAIDEAKGESRVAGLVRGLGYITNPRQMATDASEAISNRLFSERNTELLRRYAVTTENPSQFLGLLDELDRFGVQRGGAFSAPNLNAYSAPGVVSSAFASSNEQEQKR